MQVELEVRLTIASKYMSSADEQLMLAEVLEANKRRDHYM